MKPLSWKKTDLGHYVVVSFGPVAEENLPQPGQFYMFYKEYVKKTLLCSIS